MSSPTAALAIAARRDPRPRSRRGRLTSGPPGSPRRGPSARSAVRRGRRRACRAAGGCGRRSCGRGPRPPRGRRRRRAAGRATGRGRRRRGWPQQPELDPRQVDDVRRRGGPRGAAGSIVRSPWRRTGVGVGRSVAATAPVAAPAQDRLHAQHELGGGERLGQVVVGAVLEAGDAVDRRAAGRQDEDRRAARLLVAADGPDDGPAVELGEHQVEDDERRRVRLDGVERGRPVGRGHDTEAVALQVRPHEPDDLRVVVDDEDRRGRDGRVGGRGRHREHRRPMLVSRRVDPVTGRRIIKPASCPTRTDVLL